MSSATRRSRRSGGNGFHPAALSVVMPKVYPAPASDSILPALREHLRHLCEASMIRTSLLAAAFAALAAPLSRSALAPQASPVTALADRYVAGIYEFFPEQAAFSGLADGPTDRLSDNSLGAVMRWQRLEDSLAAALEAVPRPAVGSPDWVTHGFLRAALEGGRAGRVCRSELWAVNQAFGWQTSMPQLAALQPVGTDSARAAAVARWRQLPRYVRTEIANLREGMRLGYTASASVVRAVISQLDGLLAAPPESLPFLDPALRDSTPAFVAAYRPLATDSVRALASEYRAFLTDEYLPRARKSNSVTTNPDGLACYRASLRQATSVDRDPETLWRDVKATVSRDSAALMRLARELYPPRKGERADIRWLRTRLERDPGERDPRPGQRARVHPGGDGPGSRPRSRAGSRPCRPAT